MEAHRFLGIEQERRQRLANSSKAAHLIPWNKGRLVGQKLPPKPCEIWAIRIREAFYSQGEGHDHLSKNEKYSGGPVALGHTKLVSTVRYLGTEVDDALEIAEQTEA